MGHTPPEYANIAGRRRVRELLLTARDEVPKADIIKDLEVQMG